MGKGFVFLVIEVEFYANQMQYLDIMDNPIYFSILSIAPAIKIGTHT